MHLLNAEVNMSYIRDILGHVDISTTEIYARVDAEKKRAILEKSQIILHQTVRRLGEKISLLWCG